MKTIPIDDLLELLNLLKSEKGVNQVDAHSLAEEISLFDIDPTSCGSDKLAELIEGCNYIISTVDPRVNSINFPTPRIPKFGRTKIFEFEYSVSARQVTAAMKKDGFRRPTIGEGLVWVKRSPYFKGPIALLGQVAKIGGFGFVGVLLDQNSGSELTLKHFTLWPNYYRFLGVSVRK